MMFLFSYHIIAQTKFISQKLTEIELIRIVSSAKIAQCEVYLSSVKSSDSESRDSQFFSTFNSKDSDLFVENRFLRLFHQLKAQSMTNARVLNFNHMLKGQILIFSQAHILFISQNIMFRFLHQLKAQNVNCIYHYSKAWILIFLLVRSSSSDFF